MLTAWVIHVTTYSTTPWPVSAAIGPVSGPLVAGLLGVLYLSAIFVAVRPREWQAEDELHTREIGKHR